MRGFRRIDDARDYVRWEIETAFRLGVAVLPVLGGRRPMPGRLPAAISKIGGTAALSFEAGNPTVAQHLADSIRRVTGEEDPSIFISYRRHDPEFAHLVRLELQKLGFSHVLIDTSNVAAFSMLQPALETTIASSDAVLVLIGRGWEGVHRFRSALLVLAAAITALAVFLLTLRLSAEISFVGEDGGPLRLTGDATLTVEGKERGVSFQQASEIAFIDLSEDLFGKPFKLQLKTQPRYMWFRRAGTDRLKSQMKVVVALDPAYFFAGSLIGQEDHHPIEGAELVINGTKCFTTTDRLGFFEFPLQLPICRDVGDRRSTWITPPGRPRCKDPLKLQEPPTRTVFAVDANCVGSSNPAAAPKQPRPCTSTPCRQECAARCSDGSCLEESLRCNGIAECPNGEDEEECTRPHKKILPFGALGLRYCLSTVRLQSGEEWQTIVPNEGTVYFSLNDLGSKYTRAFFGDRAELQKILKDELTPRDFENIQAQLPSNATQAEVNFSPCGAAIGVGVEQ